MGDGEDSTKLVGGGISRRGALRHTMTRGHATANQVRRRLKGSRLPLKQKGRTSTTYRHGTMRFTAKTWHPRTWEYKRMQAVPNGLLRHACGVNLQKMKALGLNHVNYGVGAGFLSLRRSFSETSSFGSVMCRECRFRLTRAARAPIGTILATP